MKHPLHCFSKISYDKEMIIIIIDCNDMMMLRWICSSKLADGDSATEIRNRLNLYNIKEVLTWNRLRWFGHLQRMDVST